MTTHQAISQLQEHFRYLDAKWTNNRSYVAKVAEAWKQVESVIDVNDAIREAEKNALAESLEKARKLLETTGLSVKGIAHLETYPVDYIECFTRWALKNPRVLQAGIAQKTELFTSHYRQMQRVIESKIATLEQYRFMKEKKLSEVTRFLRSDYAELRHWFDKIDDGEDFDNQTVGKTFYDYLINQ